MRWRPTRQKFCLVGLLLSAMTVSVAAGHAWMSHYANAHTRTISWRWNLQRNARYYGLPTVGVDAVRAWTVTTCSRQVAVAIVDSGIAEIPQLRGRVESGISFIPGESPGLDETGHGTAVAFIVAGSMNPKWRVAGICPNASVISVKVIGTPHTGNAYSLASGIRWAANHGARVINVSVGTPVNLDAMKSAVTYAIQRGSLIVAGTGNSGTDAPFYPADDPGVLAVGGSARDGEWWNQSSYGARQLVLAPAEMLVPDAADPNGLYLGWGGTSLAAPQVSGLAAMLLSLYPRMRVREVIHLIEAGARPVVHGAGIHREVGWGIIDCYRTLQLAATTHGVG